MTVALAAGTGFLVARLFWLVVGPTFALPVLTRANYRGHPVATAAGVVLPLTLLVVEAGRALVGAAGIGAVGGPGPARAGVGVVALGMGLAGLLDDLAGSSEADARGLRGHLSALAGGRLTTGGVKIVFGAAVGLVAVAPRSGSSLGRLLADGALVALAANLANLFDRAPGRVIKAGTVAFVALVAGTAAATALTGVAVVAGAAIALALDDLHERLMLGDTGSNVLGGVLGLGVVVACAPGTRNAALVAMVVLNLAGEVVSFSRVIDAVAPLRAFDRAGRIRH